jgi:transposase
MSNKSNPTVATMGIDIGKNSFHVVGLDQRGAIVLRQKWSRRQIEARLANIPRCLIGMEACVGAHHLSRKLQSHGHDARLMPAKYVRPYSKGQKNDFRDAEAIAEAVQRPTMKFVATKTADQLDLQALHRVRERLVSQRTGIINQIRAFLLARGAATSVPGSDWSPSRSRPETAQSSARYRSGAIVTCASCSSRQPGSCW